MSVKEIPSSKKSSKSSGTMTASMTISRPRRRKAQSTRKIDPSTLSFWSQVDFYFRAKYDRSKKVPFTAMQLIRRRVNDRSNNRTMWHFESQNNVQELAELANLSWKAIRLENETGIPHQVSHLTPPRLAQQTGMELPHNVKNLIVLPAAVNNLIKERVFSRTRATNLSRTFMKTIAPGLSDLRSLAQVAV